MTHDQITVGSGLPVMFTSAVIYADGTTFLLYYFHFRCLPCYFVHGEMVTLSGLVRYLVRSAHNK